MVEKFIAALVLLICIGMGLHMALPLRWRVRVQAWLHDPLRRKAHARAKAQADAAIRRARRPARGRWQGNVYRLDKDRRGDNDEDQRTLH
jgi:hypothetical protein